MAQKYTKTDLDIQKLNSTLDSIQKWMVQQQRSNEFINADIEKLKLDTAKQGTINSILSFVSGAVVVSIIGLIISHFL